MQQDKFTKPLKLLKYLCDIVSFEDFSPIKSSQNESISENNTQWPWSLNRQFVPLDDLNEFAVQVAEKEFVEHDGNLSNQEELPQKWQVKEDSYKALYLVYELKDAESDSSYPCLAIPARVDELNPETGTYYLRPDSNQVILINPAYLSNENTPAPLLNLGSEARYLSAKSWLELEPTAIDDKISDWAAWHKNALTLLEKTAEKKLDELLVSSNEQIKDGKYEFKATLKSLLDESTQENANDSKAWDFIDVYPKSNGQSKNKQSICQWNWSKLQHSVPENTIEYFAKKVASIKESKGDSKKTKDGDEKLELIELKNNSYKDIYLVYELYCSDTKESYQYLAIPAKVDNLNTNTGTYELRPVTSRPVLINSAYFEDKEKPKPDLILGKEKMAGQAKIDFTAKSSLSTKTTDAWGEWHNQALDLLEKATGVNMELLVDLAKTQLRKENITINASLALAGSGNGALLSVLSLYDYVIASPEKWQQTPLPRVLNVHDGAEPNVPTQQDTLGQYVKDSVKHILGHMDESKGATHGDLRDRELFSLDNSQRLVAYKLSCCEPADTLAVNGPPGSGKTAMLKAVIGHQWVYAAYEGKGVCPITIAVGATNQSVMNVINAFPAVIYRGNSEKLLLYKRWIPACESYGTYFPARSRLTGDKAIPPKELDSMVVGIVSEASKPNVLEWYGKSDGQLSAIENYKSILEYYEEAAKQAQSLLDLENVDDVKKITQSLQARIKALVGEMEALHKELHDKFEYGIDSEFRQRFKDDKTRPQAQEIINDLLLMGATTTAQEEAVLSWNKDKLINRELKGELENIVLSKLSTEDLSEQYGNQTFAKLTKKLLELIDKDGLAVKSASQFSDLGSCFYKGLDRTYFNMLDFTGNQHKDQANVLISKLCLISAVTDEQKSQALTGLKANVLNIVLRERIADEASDQEPTNEQILIKKYRHDAYCILIDRLLDVTYRAELFHYAARYWEGIYLQKTAESLLISRTEENVEEGLRRMCMLTPCLVSTLHTVPKLFALDKAKSTSLQRYLLGKADLLIMDETGQAQQRLATPLLALAKKVLAVGDVKQLQPVIPDTDVSITEEQHAFHKHGYSKAEYKKALENHTTTKQGSMLHLLLRASKFSHQGLGLLLRGHYRCQTNIIQICNEMVYGNKLFFMPHDLAERGPFHSFCWANSSSPTQRVGSSRVNFEEARLIADFIFDNWSKIYVHYKKETDKKDKSPRKADELIAIVTPFSKQSGVLRDALLDKLSRVKEAPTGLDKDTIKKVTINTVDSLQGAERPVVIFSGVHGSKDKQDEPFFAKQPFLINVAVSRAKDCFIAFICQDMYGVATEHTEQSLDNIKSNSAHYLGYYLGSVKNQYGDSSCMRLFPNKLVVIEAGGKAQKLQDHLGTDYQVLVTGGSITELNECNLEQLVENGLNPGFKLLPNGEQVINEIVSAATGVNEVILATDDDYVGESIAWHLKKQLEVKGHKSITDKISRVRLKAITKDAVIDAFRLERVKELESERGALKAAEQLITEREKIDVQKVKAEIVRQVTDLLLSKRFAAVHDEAIDATKRQEQDIDELCKASDRSNKPIDRDVISNLVKRNLISINHEQFNRGKSEAKTRPQMAIDLSSENSKKLEQALEMNLIDKEHKQTLLFSGSLGRVKIAMLDLLYQHMERQLTDKNEHQVVLTLNNNTLEGKICGDKGTVKNFKVLVDKRIEKQAGAFYTGDLKAWVLDVEKRNKTISPPSTSTVEILEYAASDNLKLLPEITMASLQMLYTGDY